MLETLGIRVDEWTLKDPQGVAQASIGSPNGIAQLVHGRAAERIAQVTDQVVTGIAKLIDGWGPPARRRCPRPP